MNLQKKELFSRRCLNQTPKVPKVMRKSKVQKAAMLNFIVATSVFMETLVNTVRGDVRRQQRCETEKLTF